MNHPSSPAWSHALLFLVWGLNYVVIIPLVANVTMTTSLVIYIASHRSLSSLDAAIATDDKSDRAVISGSDAYKMPVFASAALFSFYMAFKYFDKDTLNFLISIYFAFTGTFSLTPIFAPIVQIILRFGRDEARYGKAFTVPVVGEVDLTFTFSEFIAFCVSAALCAAHLNSRHYMLNNIIGICLSIQAIEKISIGSYKIAVVLLLGMFVYDIYWVYGTDVMVTVAKSFDIPVKLLFPTELPSAEMKGKFSLLGLGDIVLPGLFVALLLRLDASIAKEAHPEKLLLDTFRKPFFTWNLIAYVIGLGIVLWLMLYLEMAQPALVVLVPACLLASILAGVVEGKLGNLMAYSEEEEEEGSSASASKKED